MTLKEYIEANKKEIFKYVRTKSIENILNGTKQNSGIYNIACACLDIDSKGFDDDLSKALFSVCQSYTSRKKTIVEVCEALCKYLKRNKNLDIYLPIPEFDYTNPVERQLFIIKYLHPSSDHNFSGLTEVLWMYNEDAIKDDISAINNGSLSFLGKSIQVDIDSKNTYDKKKSSGHPIIMVENLTQILVQLEGLKYMYNDASTKLYALETARTIWNQLSDYAKNRIIYVLEELLDKDTAFYKNLNEDTQLFHDERYCSNINGMNGVIHFLKNDLPFYIAYNDNNKVIKRYVRIDKFIDFDTAYLYDLETNETFNVSEDDVICAAENKNEFINFLGN